MLTPELPSEPGNSITSGSRKGRPGKQTALGNRLCNKGGPGCVRGFVDYKHLKTMNSFD